MIKAFPWKTRETPASQSAPAPSEEAQLSRVEAKLNRLMAAVAANSEVASQMQTREAPRAPVRRSSLAATIAEVSRRQQELENAQTAPRGPQAPFGGEPQNDSRARATSLLTLQNDIAGLAGRLDTMQREQAVRYATPVCNLDKFRTEIAAMSDALRGVASRGSVATVESAIRGLSQKIEESRHDGIKDTVLRPMEELVAELRQSLAEIDPRMTIKGLEGELKKLGAKIEDLNRERVDPAAFGNIQAQTREIRDLLSAAIARPQPIERIERQVAELAQAVNQQRAIAASGGYGNADSGGDNPHFSTIEARLEDIATKVEESLKAARDQSAYRDLSDRIDNVHTGLSAHIANVQRTSTPDTSALEDLVRSLSDKIERATAPQADHQAIEALEAQISALAERMEHSNTAVSINALERAIGELFGEFERTRAASLEVAEQTARSAVGAALANIPDHNADQARLSDDLNELRAKHDEADQRTLVTLNAVHETLERVVERLSSFEAELGDRFAESESLASGPAPIFALPRDSGASKNSPAPPPFAEPRNERGSGLDLSTGAPEDFLIEPGLGFPRRRDNGNPVAQTSAVQTEAFDVPSSRSDFIAAARRAAQAAQRETAAAAVLSQVRPGPTLIAENQGGLLQSTRDLIAHYRRPVVLSLAAIFVAVGAYAVLKTLGHPPAKMSSIDPPAAVASLTPDQVTHMTAPRGAVGAMTAAKPDDSLLSPNSIVAAPQIPPTPASPSQAKIDPVVTGSIPHRSLAHESKPRQISFADLRSDARAGDARAQFTLAVEYTEGQLIPRDLAAAAQWYEKAAVQGLAPAQYRLASFYEKGLGVERDIAKAQSLYQKAADQGNIRAMHNLAVLAADGGESGRPDYATAAHWFKHAAEYGVRDSQYNFAVLLARGMGVPQDFLASYVWFAIAAQQGDPDSASKRDDVAARLSPNQLATAKAIVEGFRPRTPLPAANDFTLPVISMSTRPATEPPTFSFSQRPKVSML